MLPVFIPLLMPLTIIAIPMADLVLAIVRRTWNGQSPFAADRGTCTTGSWRSGTRTAGRC